MNTKTFFFNEATTKSNILSLLHHTTQSVEQQIDTITKMTSGNKIGYFQFLNDNIYYKFYIMPKIYQIKEGECNHCELYKKEFISFLKHYYSLVAKYNIQKYTDGLGGNISDLGFNSANEKNNFSYANITDIDDFVVHNYSESLKILEHFFIKHKKQILIEQEFKSQSIKNKLNIKKNLLNPDKSFVYQTKQIPMVYSKIALITTIVLNEFLNKKLRKFSNVSKASVLKKEVNKLSVILKKRLSHNPFKFNLKDLLSRKTSKLFEKDNSYKLVYKSLLKLASKEHYYNGDMYQKLIKEEETVSLFFQPEKLYEWIVYDKLLQSNKFDKVFKDDKDDIKENYFLEPSINNKKYISKPDILVQKNDILYPVDAKWKILNTKNNPFDNDVAKLRRDAKIRNSNKGYLVYPKSISSSLEFDKEYNYSFDNDFKFELKMITI